MKRNENDNNIVLLFVDSLILLSKIIEKIDDEEEKRKELEKSKSFVNEMGDLSIKETLWETIKNTFRWK